ncbi:MAG TPA: phosphotransferase [Anaeromyxobacteraceae bacterium]|nr:phosphotransferase [Anaeromyxobacteraceae bacterium]
MLRRDPELAFRPNKFATDHRLERCDGVIHLRGYQDFTVDPRTGDLRACGERLAGKEALLGPVLSRRYMAGRSILDLGGNNGYFALRALRAGASAATVVDMDEQCIRNVEQLAAHLPGLPVHPRLANLEDWREPADGVFALALIHWVYSCTARLLSLERILERLAGLARDFLVVEWVDPEDPLVRSFLHTEVEGGLPSEPYTSEQFSTALANRFPRVELLGELSPTRRIFLASRGPIPDLSWEAPLPFPKEDLLSARKLWALDRIEFYSRVFREGDFTYKQCTPALGERELAGLRALGVAAEAVAQNDQFWLLRMPYVEGETLDERSAHGELQRARILDIARQLISQVAALRRAGVAHRDLHPANVIVAPDDSVHIIDFSWASAPGLAELTPPCLAVEVEQPATRTTIRVKPPEASGDDLFAVGRIVAWLDRSGDPELGLIAAWLGHPDYRFRLRDEEMALEFVERCLQAAEGKTAESALPPALARALAHFAGHAVRETARCEAEASQLAAQREDVARQLAAVREQSAEVARELARARDEAAELRQRLELGNHELQAISSDRDALRSRLEELSAEHGASLARVRQLDESIYWMKRSRFWQLRERWFALKRWVRRSA